MPYTPIEKTEVDGKTKWCFKKKETGERICSLTEKGAIAAMRSRYYFHAHPNAEPKKK
jgi:hypothetical protein